MNLAQLTLGQSAIIERIDDQDVYLKLLDLGCLPGEKVRLEFIAPLGDPIAIKVSGSVIGLRKADAKTVHVTPV